MGPSTLVEEADVAAVAETEGAAARRRQFGSAASICPYTRRVSPRHPPWQDPTSSHGRHSFGGAGNAARLMSVRALWTPSVPMTSGA